MEILLLGGTAFLGRAITNEAIARNHQVTCLARGSRPVPAGATLIRADRDQDEALTDVPDQIWDAVIDLTRQPVHARRAVRDLNARHWVYVSSSSVYARNDVPGRKESAETLSPLEEDFMSEANQYGPAKVACESAYRDNNLSHTIVRSGLIGGAGDHSGRSGYYPWRFAHPTGDDVLVPDPSFPISLIDAADLAGWIINCAEQRHYGTFNAAGPTTTLSEVLRLSREITNSPATVRVVGSSVLADAGVIAWMGPKSLPLWVDEESWRYVATLDTTAARAHGLRTRPLRETLRAALDDEETRSDVRAAGLSDHDERALLQRL